MLQRTKLHHLSHLGWSIDKLVDLLKKIKPRKTQPGSTLRNNVISSCAFCTSDFYQLVLAFKVKKAQCISNHSRHSEKNKSIGNGSCACEIVFQACNTFGSFEKISQNSQKYFRLEKLFHMHQVRLIHLGVTNVPENYLVGASMLS